MIVSAAPNNRNTMLKPPRSGSPFRRLRRSVLTASILPAALVTQVWAVDWNGPVSINVDPTVAVGLLKATSMARLST